MSDPQEWQRQRCEENVDDWMKQRQRRFEQHIKEIRDFLRQKNEGFKQSEQEWLAALEQVVGSRRADEVCDELDITDQVMRCLLASPSHDRSSDTLSPLHGDNTNGYSYFLLPSSSPAIRTQSIEGPQTKENTPTELVEHQGSVRQLPLPCTHSNRHKTESLHKPIPGKNDPLRRDISGPPFR